jgi:hypothetical protein
VSLGSSLVIHATISSWVLRCSGMGTKGPVGFVDRHPVPLAHDRIEPCGLPRDRPVPYPKEQQPQGGQEPEDGGRKSDGEIEEHERVPFCANQTHGC